MGMARTVQIGDKATIYICKRMWNQSRWTAMGSLAIPRGVYNSSGEITGQSRYDWRRYNNDVEVIVREAMQMTPDYCQIWNIIRVLPPLPQNNNQPKMISKSFKTNTRKIREIDNLYMITTVAGAIHNKSNKLYFLPTTKFCIKWYWLGYQLFLTPRKVQICGGGGG
jgi:hypothetical protein